MFPDTGKYVTRILSSFERSIFDPPDFAQFETLLSHELEINLYLGNYLAFEVFSWRYWVLWPDLLDKYFHQSNITWTKIYL